MAPSNVTMPSLSPALEALSTTNTHVPDADTSMESAMSWARDSSDEFVGTMQYLANERSA